MGSRRSWWSIADFDRVIEDGARPLTTRPSNALSAAPRPAARTTASPAAIGAREGATIYTIIATCKLCGIEPTAYVTDVLSKIENGTLTHGELRDVRPDSGAGARRCPH